MVPFEVHWGKKQNSNKFPKIWVKFSLLLLIFLLAHVMLDIRTVILVPDLPTNSQIPRQTFETKDFSIWELYI